MHPGCAQGQVKVKGHVIRALLCYHENRFFSQANDRIKASSLQSNISSISVTFARWKVTPLRAKSSIYNCRVLSCLSTTTKFNMATLQKFALSGCFLPCNAERRTVFVIVILSVRPSVCLSHSCTVSTWFDLRS